MESDSLTDVLYVEKTYPSHTLNPRMQDFILGTDAYANKYKLEINSRYGKGSKMQLMLHRCNNCGWSTFDPHEFFAEVRMPDGCLMQICPECIEALEKRRDKYELRPEIQVPHVKR